MRNKLFHLVFCFSIILISNCKGDDDISQSINLDGVWNIKNISGGIGGMDENYKSGDIIWTFNTQALTLKVENNNDLENNYSNIGSGMYPYFIVEDNGKEYLEINNNEYGSFRIIDDKLTINQNETSSSNGADGFILEFER